MKYLWFLLFTLVATATCVPVDWVPGCMTSSICSIGMDIKCNYSWEPEGAIKVNVHKFQMTNIEHRTIVNLLSNSKLSRKQTAWNGQSGVYFFVTCRRWRVSTDYMAVTLKKKRMLYD